MIIHNHFLPQDAARASEEFHSFKDCLTLTLWHTESGNMKLANERLMDTMKSLHELTRLAEKKNEVDQRNLQMERMGTQGVYIEVARGKWHE